MSKEYSQILNVLKEDTNTSLFIMPVFGYTETYLKEIGFKNAFISDKDKYYTEDGKYRVFALFRPSTKSFGRFKDLCEKLNSSGVLLDDYDYPEGYVVLVLEFPEKYNRDYEFIVNGKYSKVSLEYKNLMPQKVFKPRGSGGIVTEEYTIQFHVMHRTPGMKKFLKEDLLQFLNVDEKTVDETNNDEYWATFNEKNKEVLDIEMILQKDELNEKNTV